jgi:hypothetical protein
MRVKKCYFLFIEQIVILLYFISTKDYTKKMNVSLTGKFPAALYLNLFPVEKKYVRNKKGRFQKGSTLQFGLSALWHLCVISDFVRVERFYESTYKLLLSCPEVFKRLF